MNKKFWDIRSISPPVKSKKTSICLVLLIFFLAGIGFLIFNFYNFIKDAKFNIFSISRNFKEAVSHLSNFELEKAKDSFELADSQINSFYSKSKNLGLTAINKIDDVFKNLFAFSQKAVAIGENLTTLSSQGFNWLLTQQGEKLINKLEELKNNLNQIVSLGSSLQEEAAEMNYPLEGGYLNIIASLYNNQRFLDELVNWLESPSLQYFLIFFQNPSEMRPTGGFIGSYADLIFKKGNLININVRDIYYPDGQLDLKIIPPRPLQGITPNWGARDANWFFDFPFSAQKVIDFLENSRIYQEENIKFSGAMAINIEVIKDILSVIGPIYLEAYNLEINNNNVLEEIQEEVEAGEDKKVGQPKRILQVLMPIVFENLGNLDERQKQFLASLLAKRLENKDIMIYFKNLAIETYLQDLGIGGEMKILPKDFQGDYLAVINTNIAGAKSDAFIKQEIKVESEIDEQGEVNSHLILIRRHQGENQEHWWYRKTNHNYLQILLPQGTELLEIKGNQWREIKPLINYQQVDYRSDPDIAALEKSHLFLKEFNTEYFSFFDKTVFATWFSVAAGEQGILEMSYKNSKKINLKEGAAYQFIFEKQSGVQGNLEISIKAPPGYFWRESNSTLFKYYVEDPPRRVILKMTLDLAVNQPQL